VDDAVNKGLPKTAIQELEPIIAQALKDKAYPEAIRRVAARNKLPVDRITEVRVLDPYFHR